MRAKPVVIVLVACCVLLAAAASAASAAQRIDMKVLLLGTSGSEPSFAAWQAELRREGVPFDQLVAAPGHAPITAATLSQTLSDGTGEARYQAVIVAVGGLPRCDESGCASALAPDEWAALAAFEQTFHVRQLTAYAFPGADYGLNPPTSAGPLDGLDTTLTAAGQAVFPYLNGSVQIGSGTWGYGATPLEGAAFSTLLTDANGAALVGVYTHPDGREELVQTFDSNPLLLQSQLLRHGELAWVTRGTFFGDQRNYLELHVDDVFLGDDVWDTASHTTDFAPEDAVRMTPADVTNAVAWARARRVRIDAVFNGGGSVEYAAAHGGSDPLLSAFEASKATFGWINHTYEHPNLDCASRAEIVSQITQNTTWAQAMGLPVRPAELVTGEHSGLANLLPGDPNALEPPALSSAAATLIGGALPGGTYDYAVTALSAHGETTPATATVTAPATGTASARLVWHAICHALSYDVYRRVSPGGAWARIGSVPQPSVPFTATGPAAIAFRDTGAAGAPAAPPDANSAVIGAYGQNPVFASALHSVGIANTGGDASKPYPVDPTSTTGPTYPAGTSFTEGGFRVIPRYPTNVFYNVATQAQLVDEYNHIYLPPEQGGGCTMWCISGPVGWSDVVAAESGQIFAHMMGNDPRPHFFHQTNLAESGQADGAVFYPVMDAALDDYHRWFNATEPLVQLTPTQIGTQLGRQDAWSRAGDLVGWIEGATVTVVNGGTKAVTVPLSGTEVGGIYGGTRSGWTRADYGTSVHTAATAWPAPAPAAATSTATSFGDASLGSADAPAVIGSP